MLYMCLKILTIDMFKSSELFHFLRLMSMFVPSLHIESTDPISAIALYQL